MAKSNGMYHINDDDEVMPCTARKKPCQFKKSSSDGQDNHYYSQSEAYNGLADRFDERDYLAAVSKSGVGKVFTIEDNWGDKVQLVGGALNESSEYAFRNGQCLALASEMAKELGSNQIAVVTLEQGMEEDVVDEKGNLVLDEFGDPVEGTQDVIFHAYAVSKDGQTFYDVDGPIDAAEIKNGYSEDDGYKVKYSWVSEAAGYEDDMSPQDYAFAKTFTKQVLAKPMETEKVAPQSDDTQPAVQESKQKIEAKPTQKKAGFKIPEKQTVGSKFNVFGANGATTLYGGIMTPETKEVLRSEQNLAMSVALADRMGTDDIVTVTEHTSDGDKLCASFAGSPDFMTVWNVDGECTTRDIINKYSDKSKYKVGFKTVRSAQKEFGPSVKKPNYKFAETFVTGIFESKNTK